MIAVFATERDFHHPSFFPKGNYRLVQKAEDIRGQKFNDAITMVGRRFNEQIQDALDVLIQRQPELFETN